MFKLTEEQINEIILLYGGSKKIVEVIESEINLIDVIEDEEDFYEIICAVMSQKFTIDLRCEQWNYPQDQSFVFMSDDEIIETELNRKYDNFEDSNPKIKQKMLNYIDQKNRHN